MGAYGSNGTLPPMAELLEPPDHLSFSQCTTLLNDLPFGCAQKWAFERIAGIPWEPSLAMLVGSAFDDAVTALFELRAARAGDLGVPLNLDAALRVLADGVSDVALANPDADVGRVTDVLGPTLVEYADMHKGTAALAVQRDLTWWVDGEIPVVGRLDRLDRGPIIVDLKTTGQAPTVDRGTGECVDRRLDGWRLQLAFYALALESEVLDSGQEFVWPVAGAMDVVTVRSGQIKPRIDVIPLEVSADMAERARDVARRAWAVSRSGVYAANPGDPCGRCPYTGLCRESQALQAVPFKELWKRLS